MASSAHHAQLPLASWRGVRRAILWLALAAGCVERPPLLAADPLPSWNDTGPRGRIIAFVKATTTVGTPDFVPAGERIAVFDNDGTLWAEQPLPVQLAFMIDQMKLAAPLHPEWKTSPAFKALMSQDEKALADLGLKPVLELLEVANAGMTVEAYDKTIRDWLASARHPTLHRPYTALVYAPMQELLVYLRANDFKTFIVSGGSVEFMRPWALAAYGIPPEQIVGSIGDVKLEMRGDTPVLLREPHLEFLDDGPGKPVGIYRAIGHRPLIAVGNSDGDLQMLQVTASGAGKRLMMVIHHDDAKREFAYDRRSSIGRLDKAWDEATTKGWIVVSMKTDWKQIFAFQ